MYLPYLNKYIYIFKFIFKKYLYIWLKNVHMWLKIGPQFWAIEHCIYDRRQALKIKKKKNTLLD